MLTGEQLAETLMGPCEKAQCSAGVALRETPMPHLLVISHGMTKHYVERGPDESGRVLRWLESQHG